MYIKSLKFYCTPFDKNYTNVFDLNKGDGTYYSDVHEFLVARRGDFNFTNSLTPSVYLDTPIVNKSVKQYDHDFDLVVPINARQFMTNYNGDTKTPVNWVELDAGNYYYYYFVDIVESGFDNAGNKIGTTKLHFTYDVWSNTIGKYAAYKNVGQTAPQLASRATDKMLMSYSDYGVTSNYFAPLPECEFKDVGVLSFTNYRYRVAWARIRTDGSLKQARISDGAIRDFDIGSYPELSETPVFMYPLWVLDTQNMTLVDNDSCYIDYTIVSTHYNYNFNQFKLAKISELLIGDITYNPPFAYEITGSASDGIVVWIKDVSVCAKVAKITNTSGQQVVNDLPVIAGVNEGKQYNNGGIVSYNIPQDSSTLPSYNSKYTIDDLLSENNPYANSYPYRRYCIFANGAITPIVPLPYTYNIIVEVDGRKFQPTYRYYIQTVTDRAYVSMPKFLMNRGQLQLVKSAYDAYVRMNGNQIIAQQSQISLNQRKAETMSAIGVVSGAVDNISGVARAFAGDLVGGLTQAASGIGTMINSGVRGSFATEDANMAYTALQSKLNDIRNMQDGFTAIGAEAVKDIYQDLLIIRVMRYSNDEVFKSIVRNTIMYGVEYDRYVDPFTIYHECYDYFRLKNASFPWIRNQKARAIFEAIFAKGVRIWHLEYLAKNSLVGSYSMINGVNYNVSNKELI